MEWAYKRRPQIYAGSQHFADEAGWLCCVNPAIYRMLSLGADGRPNYDGIIARATPSLAAAAKKPAYLSSTSGSTPPSAIYPAYFPTSRLPVPWPPSTSSGALLLMRSPASA